MDTMDHSVIKTTIDAAAIMNIKSSKLPFTYT
jgi:hypothetical protein